MAPEAFPEGRAGQASRQGWPQRRSRPRRAGQPPGVALLYTPIPLRCGRTGAPSRVGPPLAGGLPDAASVTCFALAPASGNASGVALLYTIRSCRWWRAVYSRATPCGWPVGGWLVGGLCVWPVGGLCVWPVRVACGWLVGGLWVACGWPVGGWPVGGLWGWPVGGLWGWPVGVACGGGLWGWPLACHLATGLPSRHWSTMWPLACHLATGLPSRHWPAISPLVCHVATGLPCGHWPAAVIILPVRLF